MHKVPSIKLSEEIATLSHLVDLGGITFGDSNLVWVQYLPLGLYDHPLHGEINITPERVARFVKNFNDNVRTQELDVDYDHKQLDTKAAGWIKSAADRGKDGLWVQVEFTDPAMEALKAGEYKYFSAEFADSWSHPKTKSKHKDVMFGGALTNRPFIKDIMPINLSELLGEPHKEYKPTGGSMDPKLKARLIKLYKLSEDATDEQVLEAVEATPETAEVIEPDDEDEDEDELTEDEEKELARLNDLAKKKGKGKKSKETVRLTEAQRNDPIIRQLMEEREETANRVAALELSTRLSETTVKLQAFNETGKFAIPPALQERARDIIVRLPVKLGEDLLDLVGEFTRIGVVELGERGHTRQEHGSLSEDFVSKVTKLTEGDDAIEFAEAALRVAASDPEGFAAYRSESTQKA